MAIRQYRYIVHHEIEGEITQNFMVAYGLGHAVQKAKRLFDNPIAVVPMRKGYEDKVEDYLINKETK